MVRNNARFPLLHLHTPDGSARSPNVPLVLFPAFRQLVSCFSTSRGGIPTVNTDSYLQWRNLSCLAGGGKVEDRLLTNLMVVVLCLPWSMKWVCVPTTPQPYFGP